MEGMYVYADWCSGELFGLQYFNNEWISQPLYDFSGNPNTFGEDDAGNLYIATHGGAMYRLTDPSGGTATPTVSPTVTNTPLPPTNTSTLTATTVPPTVTATPTRTATSLPPTLTSTSTVLPPTATPTVTTIPPTPTATPIPTVLPIPTTTPTMGPPTVTPTPTEPPPLLQLYLPSIHRK